MRVAHLADPHLFSSAGARLRDFLNKRWIGRLNLLFGTARHHSPALFAAMVADINAQAIDHVICAGDIVNLSLVGEFRAARALFDRFDHQPRDLTVIPGNHDAYTAQGAEFFAEYFDDLFAGDDDWRWNDGARWPSVRVRDEIAVIGVSTSRPTPWFTAYGKVGEAQRERLARVLADPRLEKKLRLVAIHHPPVGKPARERRSGLRDHAEVTQVIAEHGAELVLHGHEHLDLRESIASAGGAIPVRGIQSATHTARDRRRRPHYRVYVISAAGAGRPVVSGEELRGWSPARECFEADS